PVPRPARGGPARRRRGQHRHDDPILAGLRRHLRPAAPTGPDGRLRRQHRRSDQLHAGAPRRAGPTGRAARRVLHLARLARPRRRDRQRAAHGPARDAPRRRPRHRRNRPATVSLDVGEQRGCSTPGRRRVACTSSATRRGDARGPAMTVGVLGAGILGLSCALRLAQAGESVVVLEKEDVPGGLAAGFPVGGAYLERFYHHLFGTDRSIVALIHELGLGSDLYWGQPNTSVLRGGRCYPLNSATAVLRFTPLPLLDRLRLGAGVAYLKLVRDYRKLPD